MPPGLDVRPGQWKPTTLETNGAPQEAKLFDHPGRQDFPDFYCLDEQHPLRPPGFTAEKYPLSKRKRFYDYVLAIHMTPEFMRGWHEVGQKTNTPASVTSVNFTDGMRSSARPIIFD